MFGKFFLAVVAVIPLTGASALAGQQRRKGAPVVPPSTGRRRC
jgi:hypothetical protein